MQIEDYAILSNKSKTGLSDAVKALLKDGWTPQGGVTVNSNYDEYIQALVKYSATAAGQPSTD